MTTGLNEVLEKLEADLERVHRKEARNVDSGPIHFESSYSISEAHYQTFP